MPATVGHSLSSSYKSHLISRVSDFASTADSWIWSKFGILFSPIMAASAQEVQILYPEQP